MKLYVGITDYDWFKLHSSKPIVDEVNFWKPSSQLGFKVLQWGEPFLFKLHAPRNFIVGGGFFTKFLRLPVSLAWQTFGEANGAQSLDEVRIRIAKYRKQPIGPTEDPVIGCILLEEPFFFEEQDWIPIPSDFKAGIQMGKSYDMETGTGLMLWREVTERLNGAVARHRVPTGHPGWGGALGRASVSPGPATIAAVTGRRFGKPQIVTPRLGQGSFRVLVADAYGQPLHDDRRTYFSSPGSSPHPSLLARRRPLAFERPSASKRSCTNFSTWATSPSSQHA